jgi:hypothetical protein
VALRDAFDAAARQLRDHMDRNNEHHGRNGAAVASD